MILDRKYNMELLTTDTGSGCTESLHSTLTYSWACLPMPAAGSLPLFISYLAHRFPTTQNATGHLKALIIENLYQRWYLT